MAVGTMSASLLALALLTCFLQVFGQGQVFRRAPGAHAVFLRTKRANQFLVEEILKGNLERECYEEQCNYEEAREVFEDNAKTLAFWTVYRDGDQCKPNPCLNGGNCTDKVGGFSCSCDAPHHGPICNLEAPAVGEQTSPNSQPNAPGVWKGGVYKNRRHEMSECPTEGPTACHQMCTAAFGSFTCSCMSGFRLQSDRRSCLPEVEFPCGRLPDASVCRHGNCPWQVTLTNSIGVELCGGVVLGRYSVLTAASCLYLTSGSDLRPTHLRVVTGNRKLFLVGAIYLHDRFHSNHHDYDLALLQLATPLISGPALIHLCLPTKDFSENILMHSGRKGVADRRGRGQNQELVYVTLDDCRRQLNISHPLSNKMFCMRSQKEPSVRRQNVLLENKLRPSVEQNITSGPNGPLQNQNIHTLNKTQNHTLIQQNATSNNHHPKALHGRRRRSKVSSLCGGLLPGSPVATVEKGTAFLTGLLVSSSSACDGQVFTKVSRYLNWIRPRLLVAEDHMTPQISQYPEDLLIR
ncbi:protein Z, vitamin K-dependent plasma glycoprotein b [Kryptolebias marmoratus]|uniref:protein Z, vitamin K-dependent plasma glycoprotein b n=1 Tax=Kryptolebias marmoratus TaxID=37003 RepID=UPI0007F8EDE7|nr:protein Z, vitamin K-dependent plasma glycoprotein b [Kryptolebias marmoratus]